MNKETAIFNEPQERIVYGVLGDTYVYMNEREVQVEESHMGGVGEDGEANEENVIVTKYEYDVRHFPLKEKTEAGVLEALKAQVLDELFAFDKGEYAQYGDKAVNDFTVNGIHMWLDQATRSGLRGRFESEVALGQDATTLWYRTTPLPLNIENAITMLHYLEVYASACYDRTAGHWQNIMGLETIEEVFNYDYTADYPDSPAF